MIYTVLVTPTAAMAILEIADYIATDSPARAEIWQKGLEVAINSLSRMRRRFGVAPESRTLRTQLRHIPHGEYRVIDRIRGHTVEVLTVRHAARKPWPGRRDDR